MEHQGGSSGSGRGGGRSRPRPIRGGRASSSAPSVGRGRGGAPEVPPFNMASSPSGYFTSSPSLYTSQSPSTPTDPQQMGQQHTPSPQSHVGEEGSSSNTPIWGTTDPSTGMLWICPDGEYIFPRDPVAAFISEQLFRNYNQAWTSWTAIPTENRSAWFDEFMGRHMSLPEHREALRKAYNARAARWLSRKLYCLRESRGRRNWLPQDTRNELFDNWATNEKFQEKRAKNKQNRAKMEGPSYVGGSIPMTEWRQKIAETGVPPESISWATFERTHSRQSEGSDEREWINSRAHTVAENFMKLSQERDSQRETDPSSSVSDNDSLFFEATGGFNKKGRVFGYGAAASRLKPTKRSSSAIEDVSPDEMKKMKALTAQMTQEQERMLEEQEKMRQMMIQEREMMEERMTKEREMMQEQMRRMQEEMMREMQLQLKSLMNKGSGSAPGDDDHAGDDDDDHNAVV